MVRPANRGSGRTCVQFTGAMDLPAEMTPPQTIA